MSDSATGTDAPVIPIASRPASVRGGSAWCPIPLLAVPGNLRKRWLRERTLPATANALALACFAFTLWANLWDVRLVWVRLGYGLLTGILLLVFLLQRFRIWRFSKGSGSLFGLRGLSAGVAAVLEGTLSCLTLLLALEAGARALPPLINSSLIHPAHRFIWPEAYAGRNSLGLNDWEPGPKKALRVLVLGDSYIEGAGVRRRERLTSQLKQQLRRDYPGAEVIAGGECGWDTYDEAHLLQRIGEQLQPDLVIVGYVLNDAEGGRAHSAQPSPWEQWLLLRVRSYAVYRWYRWWHPPMYGYWERIRGQHAAQAAGWLRTQTALKDIHNWCEQREIPHLVAVFPIFDETAAAGRPVMDLVVRTAQEIGFDAFSTLDDFDGRWLDFAVSPDDAHPNPQGHARLAGHLEAWIHSVLAER